MDPMVATFYSWLFGVLELELELCNLFLIISKQCGRRSEILAPVDVKFYWLSNDVSFDKIRILRFAVERHKVRHLHVHTSIRFGQYEKKHAGKCAKIYDTQDYLWIEMWVVFLKTLFRVFLLFTLEHSTLWQSVWFIDGYVAHFSRLLSSNIRINQRAVYACRLVNIWVSCAWF